MNDLHSMASEYAVGRLTASEMSEFEFHLATCPDCREEVAEMRDIAVQLSEAVATDPPASLRASVLAQIAQVPQITQPPEIAQIAQPAHPPELTQAPYPSTVARAPDVAEQESTSARSLEPSAGDSSGGRATAGWTRPATSSNVVPLQRRSRMTWATSLVAAAAVVAALALGGWAVQSRNDARDATAQNQELTQLLTATDVQTATGSFRTGGTATVIVSASQGKALLVAADLPSLPSGKVYEAWTMAKRTVPAGTFSPSGSQTVLNLPRSAVDAANVAVTVEPAGGSQQPTTKPVYLVKLPTA